MRTPLTAGVVLLLALAGCDRPRPAAAAGDAAAEEALPDTPAPPVTVRASFQCPRPAIEGEPALPLDAPLSALQRPDLRPARPGPAGPARARGLSGHPPAQRRGPRQPGQAADAVAGRPRHLPEGGRPERVRGRGAAHAAGRTGAAGPADRGRHARGVRLRRHRHAADRGVLQPLRPAFRRAGLRQAAGSGVPAANQRRPQVRTQRRQPVRPPGPGRGRAVRPHAGLRVAVFAVVAGPGPGGGCGGWGWGRANRSGAGGGSRTRRSGACGRSSFRPGDARDGSSLRPGDARAWSSAHPSGAGGWRGIGQSDAWGWNRIGQGRACGRDGVGRSRACRAYPARCVRQACHPREASRAGAHRADCPCGDAGRCGGSGFCGRGRAGTARDTTAVHSAAPVAVRFDLDFDAQTCGYQAAHHRDRHRCAIQACASGPVSRCRCGECPRAGPRTADKTDLRPTPGAVARTGLQAGTGRLVLRTRVVATSFSRFACRGLGADGHCTSHAAPRRCAVPVPVSARPTTPAPSRVPTALAQAPVARISASPSPSTASPSAPRAIRSEGAGGRNARSQRRSSAEACAPAACRRTDCLGRLADGSPCGWRNCRADGTPQTVQGSYQRGGGCGYGRADPAGAGRSAGRLGRSRARQVGACCCAERGRGVVCQAAAGARAGRALKPPAAPMSSFESLRSEKQKHPTPALPFAFGEREGAKRRQARQNEVSSRLRG